MSKHRRRPEERRIDRHIRLYHWVMDTPAWKSLPAAARAVYVGLLRHYNGTNNGRIGYSVRQAADNANLSRATAWRMLNLLQDCGFVVLMTKGAFNRKTRHATEWRLTEFACDVTGAMPTKDFARWTPDQDLEHGTTSETVRFHQKYRSVLPVKQVKAETPSYGFTSDTENTLDGITSETLLVNQGRTQICPSLPPQIATAL